MTDTGDTVYVIAEAGVNHDGDPARARALIDVAADAGADAVKFQTFVPAALAAAGAARAAYQQRNLPGDDSQLDMLRRLALDFETFRDLRTHCASRGIDFLSSPFDTASADFLMDSLELPVIKLGSGELTNAPLLWRIMQRGTDLILSTGMATLDEVIEALGVCCLALDGVEPRSARQCRDAFDATRLQGRVTLLHCTTEYPCPPDQVNLRAMETLQAHTGLAVGYSDHTDGIAVAIAAVARGARMIEKHFTLDRTLAGPDHAASLEPDRLVEMIAGIRVVSRALGSSDKAPTPIERDNAAVARKSLVAATAIRKGEPFDADTLTTKRPGGGLAPLRYWSLLGTPAGRDYAADDPIGDPP